MAAGHRVPILPGKLRYPGSRNPRNQDEFNRRELIAAPPQLNQNTFNRKERRERKEQWVFLCDLCDLCGKMFSDWAKMHAAKQHNRDTSAEIAKRVVLSLRSCG
jgi:hypothetical protein